MISSGRKRLFSRKTPEGIGGDEVTDPWRGADACYAILKSSRRLSRLGDFIRRLTYRFTIYGDSDSHKMHMNDPFGGLRFFNDDNIVEFLLLVMSDILRLYRLYQE